MPPTRRDTQKRSGAARESSSTEVEVAPRKNRVHDWPAIERLYVEGMSSGNGETRYPTLDEVAAHMNMNPSQIRLRSMKYRWRDRREQHQLALAREKSAERRKKLTKDAVAFDESALSAAKLGVAMVTTRLSEIARDAQGWELRKEEARLRLEEGLPVDKADLRSPIYHQELVNLSGALSAFQNVGMRALGTDVNRVEVSGPDGGPLETVVNVSQEMIRDDADRTAALLRAMADSGLVTLEAITSGDDEDVEDAEVVEDGD